LEITKSKAKTKKIKDDLKRIRGISDLIRDRILMKYLEKCKVANAIKFFDWRRKLKSMNLDKNGNLALSIRLNMLRKQEETLFKDTDDITEKEGVVHNLDSSLKPIDDKINWRKLTNIATRYEKKTKKETTGFFLTETAD
jgi:hypothetical protein